MARKEDTDAEKINAEKIDIEAIAELARLALSDEEKARLAPQMSKVLDHFRVIAEFDAASDAAPETASKPPATETTEAVPPSPEPHTPWREDIARASTHQPQRFSPYLEDGGFKVPRVIE